VIVATGGLLEVTCRTAPLLVALPAALDTTAVKTAPSSASVVVGKVNVVAVAPGMSPPLRCHW
jgi:hypothetical protein